MGVYSLLHLPGNVRVETVAAAAAALLGAPLSRSRIGKTVAPVVIQRPQDHPDPAVIAIDVQNADPAVVRGGCRRLIYYFEFGDGIKTAGSCRGMMERSRAVNIALFVRLADFFGGLVVFKDHEPDRFHVVVDKPDSENCPEGGKAWRILQERLAAIQPLTQADLTHWDDFAAYREEPDERAARLASSRRRD